MSKNQPGVTTIFWALVAESEVIAICYLGITSMGVGSNTGAKVSVLFKPDKILKYFN